MKPPMDAERFKQIRERVEKATPGPWRQQSGRNSGRVVGNVLAIAVCGGDGEYHRPLFPEDAEFIAHARQDIPDLLAEVERLREEVERLRRLAEVRATEILRLDAMIAPWPDR